MAVIELGPGAQNAMRVYSHYHHCHSGFWLKAQVAKGRSHGSGASVLGGAGTGALRCRSAR
eukprot:9311920-Lingulodinium_polyedra.AAC.1